MRKGLQNCSTRQKMVLWLLCQSKDLIGPQLFLLRGEKSGFCSFEEKYALLGICCLMTVAMALHSAKPLSFLGEIMDLNGTRNNNEQKILGIWE